MEGKIDRVSIATISSIIRDINNETEGLKESLFSTAKIDGANIEISDSHISISFPEKGTDYKYEIMKDKLEITLSGKKIAFDDNNNIYFHFHLLMMFFNQQLPVEILPHTLKEKLNNEGKNNTDDEEKNLKK